MDSETNYFEQKFRVGWSDLDGNAHMRNTSYLEYASDTRMHYFAQKGFTLAHFASESFGPVITRDELLYLRELRLMDEFTVDLELVGISSDGERFKVRNTFRNTSQEIAASLTSDGVWFDLKQRRPREPPPNLNTIMRILAHAKDFAEIATRPH